MPTSTAFRALPFPSRAPSGSLVAYATDPLTEGYQPMHVNFGLVPPLDNPRETRLRSAPHSRRGGGRTFAAYLSSREDLFPAGSPGEAAPR